ENVARGLVVYPEVIGKNLREELPFMATENIMMAAVERGGDRQDLHERIRQHSQAAGEQVKRFARPNDLLERLAGDPAFAGLDLDGLVNTREFIGRAPEQVDTFLQDFVDPLRQEFPRTVEDAADLRV
ncbi:MAG: adenylosuccinate lyase, partial [Planctomycetales bacterium]|nr:adenylosuccinate lyase [Planctomycetales bacterium]